MRRSRYLLVFLATCQGAFRTGIESTVAAKRCNKVIVISSFKGRELDSFQRFLNSPGLRRFILGISLHRHSRPVFRRHPSRMRLQAIGRFACRCELNPLIHHQAQSRSHIWIGL